MHVQSIGVLVVFFAMATADLIGKYQNELGSTMDITKSDGSTFSGMYHTKVSSNGTALDAPVAGEYNAATRTEGTVSFAVNWRFVDDKKLKISTTSWNGLVRSDGSMHTTWLLTAYCDQEDEWAATTIGKDLFTKL